MHCRPHKPCQRTADAKLPALQNRKALADDGQVAFVKVLKRSRRGLAGQPAVNQSACVTSLLDRNLRHAGQRRSFLIE